MNHVERCSIVVSLKNSMLAKELLNASLKKLRHFKLGEDARV